MREYAGKARRFALNKTVENLREDEAYRFSILYPLQVVGEAATKVPAPVRELAPLIPWPLITGFRHAVVHGYGEVRLDKVQSILDEELGPLILALESLISEVEGQQDHLL